MSEGTSSGSKWISRLIGLAMVAGLIYWVTLGRMSGDSKKVLEQTREVFAKLPAYAPNAEYVDKLIEREHDSAFKACYKMGRRRRAAEFDSQKYFGLLVERMVADCKQAGKKDLAAQLLMVKAAARAPQ